MKAKKNNKYNSVALTTIYIIYMITSCGALSMRSAALPLENCNGAEEDASINDINGHSGNSSNNSEHCNSNNNNNNISNNSKHYGYTVFNANNSISWSKSNQSTTPALRNINNDMTKGIPRKAHQCKSKSNAIISNPTSAYIYVRISF